MKNKKTLVSILSGKTIVPRDEEGEGSTSSSNHAEFVVDEPPRDRISSSRGSRFNLLANEFGLESGNRIKFTMSREGLINGFKDLSKTSVIDPDCRYFPS